MKKQINIEVYSVVCQTSKTGFYVKIVQSWKLLTISTNVSMLGVWQGPKYDSKTFNKIMGSIMLSELSWIIRRDSCYQGRDFL